MFFLHFAQNDVQNCFIFCPFGVLKKLNFPPPNIYIYKHIYFGTFCALVCSYLLSLTLLSSDASRLAVDFAAGGEEPAEEEEEGSSVSDLLGAAAAGAAFSGGRLGSCRFEGDLKGEMVFAFELPFYSHNS